MITVYLDVPDSYKDFGYYAGQQLPFETKISSEAQTLLDSIIHKIGSNYLVNLANADFYTLHSAAGVPVNPKHKLYEYNIGRGESLKLIYK